MTSLTLDDNAANYQIRGYSAGQIKVNDSLLTNSLVIAANQLIEDWAPQTVGEITKENLAVATALKPEILIIGTGEKPAFLPIETYGELLNQGIGVEVMTTSAACRTFNALTAESRNVVAALILK